ncbi:MAG: hypothetical protein HBSAPP03_30260 [Phycisphaerae bacterium]|nr:MAG: hypothetical protein HBSAPP03_30260 [Phycisphaerae bacterium]
MTLRDRPAPTDRATFPPRMRLRHDLEFARVFEAKVKKPRGPLTGFAVPNGRPHWRLGLSIGRSAGSAVERNAIKRRVREAFRLTNREFPMRPDGGYDLVIAARAHDPLPAAEYRALMLAISEALHKIWTKRETGDAS